MILVAVGLYCLMIESFSNVVIHRVPMRRSVPRWFPTCFSWSVPELQNAHLALLSSFRGPYWVAFLTLVSALVLIAVLVAINLDLEHRLLPDVIVGPAAVFGLAFSVAGETSRWGVHPVSVVGVAAGLFALTLAYSGGRGDVKMGVCSGRS